MKNIQKAPLKADIIEMISRREQALASGTLDRETRAEMKQELADLYGALRDSEGD